MIARPKEKSCLTLMDNLLESSYKIHLDPNQKWNVTRISDDYLLNKGKTGKLRLSERVLNLYFNLEDED